MTTKVDNVYPDGTRVEIPSNKRVVYQGIEYNVTNITIPQSGKDLGDIDPQLNGVRIVPNRRFLNNGYKFEVDVIRQCSTYPELINCGNILTGSDISHYKGHYYGDGGFRSMEKYEKVPVSTGNLIVVRDGRSVTDIYEINLPL